jgi:hypothetical protein
MGSPSREVDDQKAQRFCLGARSFTWERPEGGWYYTVENMLKGLRITSLCLLRTVSLFPTVY